MVKNMTEGNSLKQIVSFAIPLLIGNIFQQMYNMFDAIIVGRYLGPQSLAAVGASSSVQFLVMGFCIGLCCGFGIPVAQRFGAGDLKQMRSCIFHGYVLTAVFAVILTTITALLTGNILNLLSTPGDIFDNAYAYLLVIFLGIPFLLLYNFLSGVLRAVGDSRTPFIFLVVSTITNIVLDLLFIIVFQLGCLGAGLATIIAQALSGILCLILINTKYKELQLSREDCTYVPATAGFMLHNGVPMGLQYSITAIGSMVLQSSNNGLGSVYVSAFTAYHKVKQLTMCPFDAFATAVANFCSQNLGANNFKRIRKGLRQGIAIDVGYGLAIGIILIFFGRYFAGMFISADNVEVLDAAQQIIRTGGYFYWSLGFLNVCRMTTQGLGYSLRAIFSGVVEMFARIGVCIFLVPLAGFGGICFADCSAWITSIIYIVPTCIYVINRLEKDYKACGQQA